MDRRAPIERPELSGWTPKERAFLRRLDTPEKIQRYLNGLSYNPGPTARSPRAVMKFRSAHCFEGAMFAAAALRFHGYPPLLLDMMSHNDDDHVLALFKAHNCWGAIAKSNFTTIRFREPVYRTIRELVMSYFDFYYNTLGEKTLRSYSRPVDLSRFDRLHWMTTNGDLEAIGDYLSAIPHTSILTPAQVRSLRPIDPALAKSGLLGSRKSGLFKPASRRTGR